MASNLKEPLLPRPIGQCLPLVPANELFSARGTLHMCRRWHGTQSARTCVSADIDIDIWKCKEKPGAGQTAFAFAVFIAVRSFHPDPSPESQGLYTQ